jgi:hypothetical protein
MLFKLISFYCVDGLIYKINIISTELTFYLNQVLKTKFTVDQFRYYRLASAIAGCALNNR